MKKFMRLAAQGDVLLIRRDALPDGIVKATPQDGKYIVAHSETGHHHTLAVAEATLYDDPNDELVGYIEIDNLPATLTHERSFDTHEPLQLDPGMYEVRRQREYTPEGWRRAAD